jgi:murein DD-endopeptidase MepM/ murein hydrolase activator NlpD
VLAELERLRGSLDLAMVKADAAYRRVQAMAEASRTTTGEAAPVIDTGATLCPIRGAVAFTNDFGAPRDNGTRRHQGNDLFSVPGTANVAAVSGTIRQEVGGLGGNAVWLDGDDHIGYYYAHLTDFVGPPRRVTAGEVIGFTGNTGNAAGGPHHTHFEVHPDGGPAVNPYVVLRGLCG